jgi:hypothetical protein
MVFFVFVLFIFVTPNFNSKQFSRDDVFQMYLQTCKMVEYSIGGIVATSTTMSTRGKLVYMSHTVYEYVLFWYESKSTIIQKN